MNKDLLSQEKMKVIVTFLKYNIVGIISNILDSEEISSENTMSFADRDLSDNELNELAEKAIKKEMVYFMEEYDMGCPEDYAILTEQLTKEELTELRRKFCREVLEERG